MWTILFASAGSSSLPASLSGTLQTARVMSTSVPELPWVRYSSDLRTLSQALVPLLLQELQSLCCALPGRSTSHSSSKLRPFWCLLTAQAPCCCSVGCALLEQHSGYCQSASAAPSPAELDLLQAGSSTQNLLHGKNGAQKRMQIRMQINSKWSHNIRN